MCLEIPQTMVTQYDKVRNIAAGWKQNGALLSLISQEYVQNFII